MRPLFAAALVTTLTDADPYADVPDPTRPGASPAAAPAAPSVPAQRRPVHDQDPRRRLTRPSRPRAPAPDSLPLRRRP